MRVGRLASGWHAQWRRSCRRSGAVLRRNRASRRLHAACHLTRAARGCRQSSGTGEPLISLILAQVATGPPINRACVLADACARLDPRSWRRSLWRCVSAPAWWRGDLTPACWRGQGSWHTLVLAWVLLATMLGCRFPGAHQAGGCSCVLALGRARACWRRCRAALVCASRNFSSRNLCAGGSSARVCWRRCRALGFSVGSCSLSRHGGRSVIFIRRRRRKQRMKRGDEGEEEDKCIAWGQI